ncbi:MGMT family protein [bacterium]|nr:MGMT family protein [bacterium]
MKNISTQTFAVSSPTGKFYIEITARGIKSVSAVKPKQTLSKLPNTKLGKQIDTAFKAFQQGNFSPVKKLPIDAQFTPFQKTVFSKLKMIPAGKVITYGELAKMVKKPQAARAVGNALNKNPLLLVIPCHRVVGSTGKMTGFACGVGIKEKLLKHEGLQIKNGKVVA